MKRIESWMARGCAAWPGLLALLFAAAASGPRTIIAHWPKLAQATAKVMMEKYGRPDQFDDHALVWFKKGPWKRTIVYRKAMRHEPRGIDKDVLQQTIGYLVPVEKMNDIARFNRLIEVSQTAGELTVCSDSESKNYLTVNLAHQIATGKMSVEEARAAYAKTSRLEMAGKSSPDLKGFQFEVDNDRVMIPTGGDSGN